MNKHSSENLLDNNESIKLQVLICTLGEAGIQRVAKGEHPRVPGVEYLVSWQLPDGDAAIPDELLRPDFKIIKTKSIGIANNRNNAIFHASAPISIMTDDDVSYNQEELQNVINCYSQNPNIDFITFKYNSSRFPKKYPRHTFNLNTPPKGYYVSCIEITFRTSKIKNIVSFNEHFGFHTTFHGGEEDIFIHDCLKAGLNGIFIPDILGTHNHSTTGNRDSDKNKAIICKGAIFYHTHTQTWPLRMFVHAYRYSKSKGPFSFFNYCYYWLKGIIIAYNNKVFK